MAVSVVDECFGRSAVEPTASESIWAASRAHRLRGLHLQPASTRDAAEEAAVEAAPRSRDHGRIRDAVQRLGLVT
jgi:hypothetical protein